MLLKGFVRPFVIEPVTPAFKTQLLGTQMGGRWLRGLGLQGLVHALMPTILFGMTGCNAFMADIQADEPCGETRDRESAIGERIAVVGPDGLRQTVLSERLLEPRSDEIPSQIRHRPTTQHVTTVPIDNGKRITV